MSEKQSDQPNKKGWTEAERLELAAKLDKDLEDYIDNLDKKSYSEGWPEDRWQEEMEKHPFFMTQLPENPTEVSPLIEGLQQLKYSEEYNTPNELAQSYKEDGNFNYKHKKYRLAILCFSKGISSKCENTELMAQLYNNRALAQYKLQNYRSGLNDSKQALKLKPDYLKPLHTAAKCCFKVKNYDECISYCDQVLNMLEKKNQIDHEIVTLRAKAVKDKKIKLRDSRLQELKEKKGDKIREEIIEAIKASKIRTDNSDIFYDSQCHVHLDETGEYLVWPVIFAYPVNNQTDFIQNFQEDTLLIEQLEEMFKESPAWDTERAYKVSGSVNTLNVYYEGVDRKPYKVDVDKPLGSILQEEKFIVKNGTPWFFVLLANSREEESFLKAYR